MHRYFCEDTSLVAPYYCQIPQAGAGKKEQLPLVASAVMAPYMPLVHLREKDPAVSDLLGFQGKHQAA